MMDLVPVVMLMPVMVASVPTTLFKMAVGVVSERYQCLVQRGYLTSGRKMNHRFKTKPVEVEAFQITKKTRMDSTDWPVWLEKAWTRDEGRVGAVFRQWHKNVEPDRLCLKAPEGVLLIDWNDWIIRGEDKQLYLCKPNIFETLYEPVRRKRSEE